MAGTVIALTNHWKSEYDDQLAHYAPALQHQLNADLQSAWGVGGNVTLQFVPYGKRPPRSNAWVMEVRAKSNVQGALGYHLDPSNRPTAYVFGEDITKYGVSLSVSLSHELLEMVVDPTINLIRRRNKVTYAVEVADPVEDDSFAYLIDDVQVSDFITPAWYGGDGPFDFKAHCTAPGQLLKGGYCSEFTNTGGWHQVFATTAPKHQQGVGRPGSSGRTTRRFAGR